MAGFSKLLTVDKGSILTLMLRYAANADVYIASRMTVYINFNLQHLGGHISLPDQPHQYSAPSGSAQYVAAYQSLTPLSAALVVTGAIYLAKGQAEGADGAMAAIT